MPSMHSAAMPRPRTAAPRAGRPPAAAPQPRSAPPHLPSHDAPATLSANTRMPPASSISGPATRWVPASPPAGRTSHMPRPGAAGPTAPPAMPRGGSISMASRRWSCARWWRAANASCACCRPISRRRTLSACGSSCWRAITSTRRGRASSRASPPCRALASVRLASRSATGCTACIPARPGFCRVGPPLRRTLGLLSKAPAWRPPVPSRTFSASTPA